MRYLSTTHSKIDKRYIVCYQGREGKKFSHIKAGLAFSTPISPGYYCILGEEYRQLKRLEEVEVPQKGKLILLADKESKNGLLVEVIDQTRLAGVTNVSIAAIPK